MPDAKTNNYKKATYVKHPSTQNKRNAINQIGTSAKAIKLALDKVI